MSKTKNPPTPAELAAFVAARTGGGIFDLDSKAFRRAVSAWREWEDQIESAWASCEDAEAERSQNLRRVPFREVVARLGSQKTIRSYFEAAIFTEDDDGGWLGRKINGFPRYEVRLMEQEQSKRLSARGRTAALKKHRKVDDTHNPQP